MSVALSVVGPEPTMVECPSWVEPVVVVYSPPPFANGRWVVAGLDPGGAPPNVRVCSDVDDGIPGIEAPLRRVPVAVVFVAPPLLGL